MFPLPANIYFEIAAFITSVIFWRKIKNQRLRWLIPFLLFISIVEISGRYIYKELHASNNWLYNISVPIEYLFYPFLFSSSYQKTFSKICVKIFLIAFPIWAFLNLFFIQGYYNFNTNFLKAGTFFMLFFCCLVFVELLLSEELINPFTQPVFWIACGVFIFNAGEFTYNAFSDIITRKWKHGEKLFHEINNNLIFVLYTAIIIAIISSSWATKEKT